MTQMKEPVEFLVMPQPGIGISRLRETLESHIEGLEFLRTIPFSCVRYRAERDVFERLQRTYEQQYGEIIAAIQRAQFKPSL